MTQPDPRPVLRIVGGGEPSDEELAALVVALSTRGSGGDVETTEPRRWAASGRPGGSWVRGGWVAAARRSAFRPNR